MYIYTYIIPFLRFDLRVGATNKLFLSWSEPIMKNRSCNGNHVFEQLAMPLDLPRLWSCPWSCQSIFRCNRQRIAMGDCWPKVNILPENCESISTANKSYTCRLMGYFVQLLEGCKVLCSATIINYHKSGWWSKHSGLWSNWCCNWILAVCSVLAKPNWKEDPDVGQNYQTPRWMVLY